MELDSILVNTRDSIIHGTDLRTVENQLQQDAKQLAILGEVDAARDLIALLFQSHNVSRETPLVWAWKETAQWPKGSCIPTDPEATYAQLRKEWEEGYWGTGRPAVPDEHRRFDETGLQACLNLSEWARSQGHLDASTGWMAMEQSVRLVKALDISVRLSENKESQKSARPKVSDHGEDEDHAEDRPAESRDEEWERLPALDDRSLHILEQMVSRWDANQQVEYMCLAEHLWPMYLSGIVAEAMRVDRRELKAKAGRITEAYSQRLSSAFAATPFANKSLKEILDTANENTLRGSGENFWREMGKLSDSEDNRPQTLFHKPASRDDIKILETRLGVSLPDDYKEFLKISNGFGAEDEGIFNGYCPDPALYGTDEVNWNHEEYFELPCELLELPREIEQLAEVEIGPSGHETALPFFGPVLEIGTRDIDNMWLVQPELVQQAKAVYKTMYARANTEQRNVIEQAMVGFAGSREAFDRMEWCCMEWSAGGAAMMTSYSSFRRYLEIVTTSSAEAK